jgi:hypothetical protein
MIPNWTLFSAWHRQHLIVGEYRLDGDLIFVRDQRGALNADPGQRRMSES